MFLLDIDEQTGKVNQILNHDEIIKQWDQCKDSLRKNTILFEKKILVISWSISLRLQKNRLTT